MLIVEEMFLLLTRDHGTTDRVWGYRRHGLVAAALADLAEAGFITIAEGKDPKVTLVRAGMTGEPSLDGILPAVDGLSGKRISKLIGSSALDPDQSVGAHLADQGIVHGEKGFLKATTYVTSNPAPEIALRARLGQVLSGERDATLADSTELGILKALNVAHAVLGPARGDLDRRGLARRIESIVREVPAVEAVKRAVDSITAATTATVVGTAG